MPACASHPKPKDRLDSVRWAKERFRKRDFVVLDTETTGTGPKDEVIHLGVIGPSGEVLIDSFVKPKRKGIPRDASAIHGITWKDVKDSPSIVSFAPELRTLEKKHVVAYNAKFDARLLKQSFEKYPDAGIQMKLAFDCAMMAWAQYVGEINPKYGDYKWQKLPGATHGSIEDCRAVLAIMQEMADNEVPPSTLERFVAALNSWITGLRRQ